MTRPPAFRIETQAHGGAVELALHGELDLATAPELEAELARLRAMDGVERVVIDLRELVFLDSTGLQSIVRFDREAAAAGVALAVVRGPRAVERLFAVMHLDRTLRIVDDPAELRR